MSSFSFLFLFLFLIDATQLSLNNKRSSIFPQQQEEENACYKIQNAYERKFSKSISNTIDISSDLAKNTLDKTFAKLNHITQKSGNRPSIEDKSEFEASTHILESPSTYFFAHLDDFIRVCTEVTISWNLHSANANSFPHQDEC